MKETRKSDEVPTGYEGRVQFQNGPSEELAPEELTHNGEEKPDVNKDVENGSSEDEVQSKTMQPDISKINTQGKKFIICYVFCQVGFLSKYHP